MMLFPVWVLMWALMLAIKIPTALAGFVVVPLLYPYRFRDYDTLPFWTRPWANPEDWEGGHMSYRASLPKWWVNRHGTDLKSFYKYHAIRNPANGLRSFEVLDLDIDPDRVEYRTSWYSERYEPKTLRAANRKSGGYIAWQGIRAGCKYVRVWNEERHFVFKFGWRIEPKDKTVPIDPDGLRHEDAGFATKLLVYRNG